MAKRGGIDDVAKLLDFGLVKTTSSHGDAKITHDGALTGSPLYMSPEQASGDREPDARSDIYSLGCVAYHMLTGRPPFDDAHPMKVVIAHVRDQVLLPSKVNPEVPRDLEQVVIRCLAKEPHERYQDVASLDHAFGQCQAAGKWTPQDASQWWETVAPLNQTDEELAEVLAPTSAPTR